MITKEQTKMMIRDLGEEYINLSAKIDKYQALNLDCCIVADLKDAWNVPNTDSSPPPVVAVGSI